MLVPMIAARDAERGRSEALDLAGRCLAVLLAVLVVTTVGALLAMPAMVVALAPGLARDPERLGLSVELGRLAFPYLPLIAATALIGGVLNAAGRFAPFAAAPILFNIVLIAAALAGITQTTDTAGRLLAGAVTAAGVAQLLFVAVMAERAGLRIRLPRPRLDPDIRLILKRLGPGAIGAGVLQINVLLDVILASLLPAGAISQLYYADRLAQLPQGIVAATLGTALLPTLARAAAGQDGRATAATLGRATIAGLALALPAAVGLAALAPSIVRLLFERGAFDGADTSAVALIALAYAPTIPAAVLVKVLTTARFARGDMAGPMRAVLAATVLDLALSFALMPLIGAVGIALATSISTAATAAILLRSPERAALADAGVRSRVARLSAASAVLGVALVILVPSGAGALETVLAILLAILAWPFLVLASGAASRAEIRSILARALGRRAA